MLPVEPWALVDWPAELMAELTSSWDGGSGLYQRVSDDVRRWHAEPPTGPGIDIGGIPLHHTPLAVRPEPSGRWSAFSPLAWWDERDGDPVVRQAPILTGHAVTGIVLANGRAIGARIRTGDGATTDIRADRVVLAAGAAENGRLAIQALADAGAAPVGPELLGLADTIAQGFVRTIPDDHRLPPPIRAAAWSGRTYHRIGDGHNRFNHFVRFTSTSAGSITMDSWTVGEQQHADSPDDEKQRRAQQDFLLEFWSIAAHHLNVPAAPLDFGPVRHEAGTIALGELLADDHQFRDVPGLYACGPCTFPRTGATEPAMTTLALAKRLGGLLSR